jgi:hypothetical protein
MWVVRVAGLGERGRGVEFTVWEIEPIKCFETITGYASGRRAR